MPDWLNEIEEEYFRSDSGYFDVQRMARVLRELAGFVKEAVREESFVMLSDDAKELCVASSDES